MKKTLRLTERELTNLIKKIVKEQEESEYVDLTQTFKSKNIQTPESCVAKIEGDQPKVDYEKCFQDTMQLPFKDAVGVLADLTKITKEKGIDDIETQQFDLPVSENRRRNRRFIKENYDSTQQMLDTRGAKSFMDSLETLLVNLKNKKPTYSVGINATYHHDILPKFKEQFDRLYNETIAANPLQ
jgi:hypothetical protein